MALAHQPDDFLDWEKPRESHDETDRQSLVARDHRGDADLSRRAGETCGYGMQITGEVILDKRSLIHRMLEKCGYLRCKSLVNKTVCELENGHRIIEIVDLPMKNGDFP